MIQQHVVDQVEAFERDFDLISRTGDHDKMNDLGKRWHIYARANPDAYPYAETRDEGGQL